MIGKLIFSGSFVMAMLFGSSVSWGDISVNQRTSDATYDVFAAVGADSDRLLVDPLTFTDLNGEFIVDEIYFAFASFQSEAISGTADSFGSMTLVDRVISTSDSLAVDYSNHAMGNIETEGDGVSASTAFSFFDLRFDVTAPTQFRFRANIEPVESDSVTSALFRTDPFSANLPVIFLDSDQTGTYMMSGNLSPDIYQIQINASADAVTNFFTGDEPPYSMGIDFSLRVGEILLGDVNLDGVVNLLDIAPFIQLLTDGSFQFEADFNDDGNVNLLDIEGFVAALSGN